MTTGLAPARSVLPAIPFQRTVLPNGLRILTQTMPAARSVSAGLFVGVGSRHENDADAGLSHMLEHLVFKGTARYPAAGEISEAIEGCGGSVNASTDRELTVYSARVPAEASARALDVISDLVLGPLLRHRDLVAEKPVIVDEIRMYVDSPSDHIFSLFDELLFPGHPLGREIAGTPRSVRRASHAAVRGHWSRWYRPERMVLAVAGQLDHESVLDAATAWPIPVGDGSPLPAQLPPAAPQMGAAGRVRVVRRPTSQGNLCLGMPGVARDDPDRWALDLLGAVLGDGMSSRLFLELRERRSLAYDVSTFATTYGDCGSFGVHAGFDPDQAVAVIGAILEQLEAVVQDPVAESELERARAYTRGRLLLRTEETGAVAAWLGVGESLLPRLLTVEEVVEHLEAVTVDDLLRVARRCVRPQLASMAILGPFGSARRLEQALRA